MSVTQIGAGQEMLADEVEFHGLDPKRPWRIVLAFHHATFAGVIAEDDDGAVLSWNDFVANTWVEPYPTTPLALVRLALLMHASDSSDVRWFKTGDPLAFAQTAHVFLDDQLASD